MHMAEDETHLDHADDPVQEALDEATTSLEDIQQMAVDVDASVGADAAGVPLSNSAVSDEADPTAAGIELLSDVDLHVMIELGRTEMLAEDVLKLTEGSVVELDKLAGDPVDVYVNHRLIARGEVLVLSDNFCIRISEIVANLEEQAQAVASEQQAPIQAT